MIYTLKNQKTRETLAVDTKYVDEDVIADFLFGKTTPPADADAVLDALVSDLTLRRGRVSPDLLEDFALTVTPYAPFAG